MLPDEESDAERELAPDPPGPPDAEIPSELRKQFWILVIVFNIALIATSLGVMLATLDGKPIIGSSLAFLGAGAFYYGLQRYRRVKDRDFTESDA